jgi:Phage capsid family
VQAIADLQGRDYLPNAILTDSATWAKLINTKSSTVYGLPGGSGVSIDPFGNILFLGLPVLIVNNISNGIVIVGDMTRCTIVQSEGLSIAFFEQDQDNVIRNLITARVEARVGFCVPRGDAFNSFGAGTT